MKQKHLFLVVLYIVTVGMVLRVPVAEARTVVRSGNTVSLAEEQSIEGDFYVAGGKVSISGAVEEDLISLAGQASINGPVGANAFLLGGQTDVYGTVGDDLRIISGEVTIAEPVMGDVLVVAGSVDILSTASVTGDVILFAGDVTIDGSVGGSIMGTVKNLRINAPVAGEIDVTVDSLTLGERAVVGGGVRYVSDVPLIKSLNASVQGTELRSDPVLPGAKASVTAAVVPLLVLLFSVLVWYLVSRASLQTVVSRVSAKSIRSFVLGFAVLLAAPFAITVLLVSMIGTLVGLVSLFGYLLLLGLAFIASSAVLGQLLLSGLRKQTKALSLFSLVAGVVAIGLCMLLPVLGQLIFVILVVMSVGAMVDVVIKHPTA